MELTKNDIQDIVQKMSVKEYFPKELEEVEGTRLNAPNSSKIVLFNTVSLLIKTSIAISKERS